MSAPTRIERRARPRVDVVLLDPRALVPHPRNVRESLADLDGLTASIAAAGVIEPLSVIELGDGRHQLVTGHRRTAAAIAAGLSEVPCVIRRDLSVDADTDQVQAEHVGTMLAENLQRSGLTVVEEAHGVQTMLDLGMDIATVSRRTGLARDRVAKAAGVARLAPAAAAAVTGAGLTLDQAAAVARFEDADDVVKDLVAAAGEGPGRFAHAVTRAEQQRATAAALADRRAELEAAGCRVVDDSGHPRLSELLHQGEALTPEGHASCPGSAVVLTAWSAERIVEAEVCTDPAENGHSNRWVRSPAVAGLSMSDEELERQRAERSQVIRNNQLMQAANSTRRAFVRELLARRSADRAVLRFAVEAIAAYPDELHTWLVGGAREGAEAVAELGLARPSRWTSTDTTLTSGEHVVDGRLPLQLLAHIAAAIEAATGRDAWRSTEHERSRLVGWLQFLQGQGYELSDIEGGLR